MPTKIEKLASQIRILCGYAPMLEWYFCIDCWEF